MDYKMIVLDIDDTLLTDHHVISPRTKEALLKAQDIGVKVVLASGRPTFAMHKLAEELLLHDYGSYVLSFNGGIITDYRTKNNVYECALTKDQAHELYEISKKHNVFVHTYIENDIITEQGNQYTDIEGELTGMPIKEVSSFTGHVQKDVVKLLMLEDPEKLAQVEKILQKELEGKISVMRSKPFFLELTNIEVDKGKSLNHLIQILGIRQDEVIAVGDGYNDLPMIKFAGLGVAMGNAPEEIKQQADYVTATNNEDGVAQVVEKFILNNQ
ncbi:Cof-type HAD-IIB family hydrolase [Gottfriedia sp. NPDC056225]|uniref:Cof-type HAD-IIB family hydrolase n=1 Tax=Gottfriedia sp. NPDC056225 TaxID=3345751 RepID=UPI0035D877ED